MRPDFIKTVPNILSFIRLFLVPVVIWLLLEELHVAAFWTFVAAGAMDALDGYIARRFDARTTLGGYLDPIADKALITGVYVSLGLTGQLESWLVILVVFRDLLIVGGVVVLSLLEVKVAMRPLLISKTNTFLQVTTAALVLASHAIGFSDSAVIDVFVWLTAATTVASGGAYLYVWGRRAVHALDAG